MFFIFLHIFTFFELSPSLYMGSGTLENFELSRPRIYRLSNLEKFRVSLLYPSLYLGFPSLTRDLFLQIKWLSPLSPIYGLWDLRKFQTSPLILPCIFSLDQVALWVPSSPPFFIFPPEREESVRGILCIYP